MGGDEVAGRFEVTVDVLPATLQAYASVITDGLKLAEQRPKVAPDGRRLVARRPVGDVDVHQDWGQGTGSVSDPKDCQRDAVAAGFEIVRLTRFPIVDWKLYELVVRKPSD